MPDLTRWWNISIFMDGSTSRQKAYEATINYWNDPDVLAGDGGSRCGYCHLGANIFKVSPYDIIVCKSKDWDCPVINICNKHTSQISQKEALDYLAENKKRLLKD